MHIVIDARMIGGKMHGIARYTYNLIRNLLKIDHRNQYTILVPKGFHDLQTNTGNLESCYLNSKWISVSEQWELVKTLRVLKPDLFHTPSFVAPIFNPFPMIMTIHDVNHIVFADDYSLLHRLYYKFIVKPSANKSVRVLTVSEFSKQEINKYLLVPHDKIKVIYNGCDDEFRTMEDMEAVDRVREKYGLPRTFIFYAGGYKPHKNLSNLITAYAGTSLQVPLVLSGNGNKNLLGISRQLGVDKKVLFAGEIEKNDLPVIYNCATLFVFPSLYEGFGFPPIEAMACGCPVVVSNATSLPEVCGDAAYYVSPYDIESIAEGMYRVITNEGLKKSLIEKGLRRAKMFRWDRSAEEHLRVFEEVKNLA